MPSYLETVKSYTDVPFTNEGIETQSFLEASDGLLKMFELFDSTIFGFVQSDIRENIKGVRDRYQASREVSSTIENLVKSERTEPHHDGTECLVRLIRGLSLVCKALQSMQKDPTLASYACFQGAYEAIFENQHPWVLRAVINFAIRAVPRRDLFFQQIAQGASLEKFDIELANWLVALDRIVSHTSAFLEQGGFGKV